MTISRIMLNEMDSARFDPLLGRGMARLIGKAVDAITGKVDGLVCISLQTRTGWTLPLTSVSPYITAHQGFLGHVLDRTVSELCASQQYGTRQLCLPHCL